MDCAGDGADEKQELNARAATVLRNCDVAHGALGILEAVRKSAASALQGAFDHDQQTRHYSRRRPHVAISIESTRAAREPGRPDTRGDTGGDARGGSGFGGMRPEFAWGYGALAHSHRANPLFDSFRRWPLVPSSQLLRLRTALLQCVELASPDNGRDLSDSARKLLRLVTDELDRRSGAPAGPAVPPAGFRQARRRPHV
ncbi:hypothetical protein BJG92_00849 [Arthrobacter sp. SO5]|nr:hypothetical protein [Arthrobacter sp. SO5]